MSQNELTFQKHIIDSYWACGGHAAKWASEWQAGKPDLICALPGVGLHLMEVKHLPNFKAGSRVKNALTTLQQRECREYLESDGTVVAGVVGFSSKAVGSKLALFDPLAEQWAADEAYWVPYRPGMKFDMKALWGIQLSKTLEDT